MYEKLGDTDNTRFNAEKALKIDPQDVLAKNIMDRINGD